MPLDLLIANTVTFVIGIAAGIVIYRTIWWIDTKDLQKEIDDLQRYNTGLQRQVVVLENRITDLIQRLDLVEDANRDLNREIRTLSAREASALSLSGRLVDELGEASKKERR